MSNGQRKDWRETESTSDAVRRLTAIIDERNARKTKAAVGKLGTAPIHESQAHVPARHLGEKADDEKSTGSGMLDPRRQQLTSAQWEVGRGSVKGGGYAAKSFEESFGFEANGCAYPDAPDFAVGTDRTNGHALEDW